MPKRTQAAIQTAFSTFVILIFILLIGTLDSLPLWVLFILAILSWMALLFVWIREIRRTPTLYYNVNGQWRKVEPFDEEKWRLK